MLCVLLTRGRRTPAKFTDLWGLRMEGKGKGAGLVDVKVSPVNLRTGIIQANMEKKKKMPRVHDIDLHITVDRHGRVL